MDANGSPDYLRPGFDPASLTVPKLRNILLEHNVNYPSSAKKPQLIELFNQEIAPKAKRLLSQRARTKPSAKGIVDVPSSQASVADEEEDVDEEPPPPKEKAKRTSRRTTRQTTEDSDTTLIAPSSESSRRTSHKHARSSDAEPEDGPSSRRSRRTINTPIPRIKEEAPEPVVWHQQDDESPFTQDNPFQSGSSPPPAAPHDKRRKTLGPFEHKEKRRSAAARRKTDMPKVEQQDEGVIVPSSATFEVPISSRRRVKVEDDQNGDLLEVGEEFTPQEQEELALERARHGDNGRAVVRRRSPRQSSGGWWTLPMVLLAAVAGGVGYVWSEAKIEVGYCGVGNPVTSIGGWEVPEQLHFVLPQCEPCPQHAYCYSRLETKCEEGFILQPHPLSANGNIPLPLPPTCEPDTEKAKKIKTVADRAVEKLRERNAKFECRQLTDEDGKPAASAAVDEETLKHTVSASRKKSMTQEEFEALWREAIGEILGRDEITSGVDGESDKRKLASTSLAKLPLACAIRRSIRQALVKYIWPIVIVALFAAMGGYTRYTIAYNKTTEERAKQLASYALDRLSTQAALHALHPTTYPEAFVSMAHLRDDVLRDEFSATRRIKLWEKVQKKVEGNSNIRPMVREGRSGDRSRVWEWIGAFRAIEDGPNSSRRDSSRLSLGPIAGSSPAAFSEGNTSEMREVRNWEEGRPIY